MQEYIFATVPSGVAVFSTDGLHLGTISFGEVYVTNIAIGGDGYLYITTTKAIMRVYLQQPLQGDELEYSYSFDQIFT